jgi:hypothetical protein
VQQNYMREQGFVELKGTTKECSVLRGHCGGLRRATDRADGKAAVVPAGISRDTVYSMAKDSLRRLTAMAEQQIAQTGCQGSDEMAARFGGYDKIIVRARQMSDGSPNAEQTLKIIQLCSPGLRQSVIQQNCRSWIRLLPGQTHQSPQVC